MRKILTFFAVCAISLILISYSKTFASALPQPDLSDPGITEIINIADLYGWMQNGAEFNVSDFATVEEFLAYYQETRLPYFENDEETYFHPLFGWTSHQFNEVENRDPSNHLFYSSDKYNAIISSSFRDHVGYGNRLQEQINNALINNGDLVDIQIPLLLGEELFYFNGGSYNSVLSYMMSFQGDVTIDPDPEYLPYLQYINGNSQYSLGNYPVIPDLFTYSGICCSNTNGNLVACGKNFTDSSYSLIGIPFMTFYINGSGTAWTLTHDLVSSTDLVTFTRRNNQANYLAFTNRSNTGAGNLTTIDFSNLNGTFITLDDALTYLKNHVNQINLFVNGELWLVAGNTPQNPLPEFPDVVGGEDLPPTTWPVYRPANPYFISLPGLENAFNRAKYTDNIFDFDDIIQELNDNDFNPVPQPVIEKVPVPIPVPNKPVVPRLPELGVIPVDLPSFNGVTVLARVINVTNRVVPRELILAFWGVVFGAVILGIIKILHK